MCVSHYNLTCAGLCRVITCAAAYLLASESRCDSGCVRGSVSEAEAEAVSVAEVCVCVRESRAEAEAVAVSDAEVPSESRY